MLKITLKELVELFDEYLLLIIFLFIILFFFKKPKSLYIKRMILIITKSN